MIRTSYDPDTDAIFVWFGPEGVKSAGTKEVSPDIMLRFDREGRVIGIEVLDVRERIQSKACCLIAQSPSNLRLHPWSRLTNGPSR